MEKRWRIKLELHGKKHDVFVTATSDIDAISMARTIIKDYYNVAHIISISTI